MGFIRRLAGRGGTQSFAGFHLELGVRDLLIANQHRLIYYLRAEIHKFPL
jgi:hypothetical protein